MIEWSVVLQGAILLALGAISRWAWSSSVLLVKLTTKLEQHTEADSENFETLRQDIRDLRRDIR